MNATDAKLITDPAAITALINEVGPEAAAERMLAAQKACPPFITSLQTGLADLLTNPCLAFQDGAFILTDIPDDEDLIKILRGMLTIDRSSDAAKNMSRWIIGNIAYILMAAGVDAENHLGELDIAYNTWVTSRTTFAFFIEKRYKMLFSHHKEIAYAADLSAEQRHSIAAYCEKAGLPLTVLRKIIRAMQADVRMKKDVLTPQAYHETLPETGPKPKQYLVINGRDRTIVDHKPDGRLLDDADEVYEIRSILKQPERAAAGDAE